MKKFIYIGVTMMIIASFTGIARAEDDESTDQPEIRKEDKLMGGWFKDIREMRAEKRDTVTDMRIERKDMMDDNKDVLREGREAIKNASPEDRADLLEEQKEKREAFHEEWKNKTKEIIEARVHFAANLYQATIARLEQIAERIDSRIEKLTALGKDMASAQSAVDEARGHIENAKTAAAEIKETLESLTDKSGFFETHKDKIVKVKDELKLAHQSLKKAIEAIKAVAPKTTTE